MPRMGRVLLPHMPHHVVQRGHNRQVVFAGAEDYERYLDDLRELSSALDIRVYAYCLMTNHVHLLLGPGEEVAAMGRLMKALAAPVRRGIAIASRGVREPCGKAVISPARSRQRRTCSLVRRYIELNPVRARMVPVAGDYARSSYRQRIGEEDRWIDLDPAYLDLADNESDRRARYARFVEQAIPEQDLSLMREALQRGVIPPQNDRGDKWNFVP